ncbi:DUF5666 domain-containing protein [Williamsia sp. M5A3_1d]
MTQPHNPDQPEQQPPTEKFDAPAPPAFPPVPPAQQPPQRTSWFSGTRRTAIVAGVAGLLIGGIIGGSIGWAATGDDDTPRADAAYSRQAANGEGRQNEAAPAKRHVRAAVAGTITAINGTSWTLSVRNGRTLTVAIGEKTTFGTKKAPAQEADFRVGDRVAVVGKDVSGTIDAIRVAKRTVPAASSTPPSASVAPGATTQPS